MTDLFTVHMGDEFSYEALKVHREKRGAIDIETTVTEDPFVDLPSLVSVAITFDGNRAFVYTDMDLLNRHRHIFEHTDWIMHNGLFDKLMMKLITGFDLTLVHDTMAMQYLLDPDEPKSLEELSGKYLGLEPYKDVNYKNILEEPIEKVIAMNGEDVRRTFNLFRPLADLINKDKQLSRIYQWLLMPTVNALIQVTQNGINVDKEKLDELSTAYTERVEEGLKKLQEKAPMPADGWAKPSWWRIKTHGQYDGSYFNPASPQQVSKALYGEWGLPVLEVTDSGAASTGGDVLLRHESDDDTPEHAREFLTHLRAYRKDTKILNSYLKSWPNYIDKEGKMHPRFKPLHVVTGRLSSEKPNIQQVPRGNEFRSLFVAPPGHKWIKADYSQIELRIAAWLANEPTLLEAYHEGEDVHTLTATLVLGDPEFRQGGKTLNFGLLYGAGPKTLQRVARQDYDVWLTLAEATEHRANFFRTYPKLETWQKLSESRITSTGQSRSPLGRIRYLPHAKIPWEVEDMRGHKIHAVLEGINHQVQSFAGDLTNMAVARLVGEGLPVVCAVHDEVDLVVPEDQADEVATRVHEIMEDVSWLTRFGIKLTVPVVAEVSVGEKWSME